MTASTSAAVYKWYSGATRAMSTFVAVTYRQAHRGLERNSNAGGAGELERDRRGGEAVHRAG